MRTINYRALAPEPHCTASKKNPACPIHSALFAEWMGKHDPLPVGKSASPRPLWTSGNPPTLAKLHLPWTMPVYCRLPLPIISHQSRTINSDKKCIHVIATAPDAQASLEKAPEKSAPPPYKIFICLNLKTNPQNPLPAGMPCLPHQPRTPPAFFPVQ